MATDKETSKIFREIAENARGEAAELSRACSGRSTETTPVLSENGGASSTIYLSGFSRALIRWIPEHFITPGCYSVGALREAADELRAAAERLDSAAHSRVAGARALGGEAT
jgi:hypothetical protein